MTENKKRTALFTALAMIFMLAANMLSSVISGLVLQILGESLGRSTSSVVNACMNLVVNLIGLAATLILGRILTKDKRGSLVFAGSMFFGRGVVAIVSSLISEILIGMISYTSISDREFSTIITIKEFVFIIPAFFVAYYIYTALEGMNAKFDGSIDTVQLTLSQARKRYIIFTLIGIVVVSVFVSGPNFILNATEFYSQNTFLSSLIVSLSTWLGNEVIAFAFIYLAGYLVNRSHIDAFAYTSCSFLSSKISSIFFSLLGIPYQLLISKTQQGVTDMDYSSMLTLSISTTVYGIIVFVIEVAVMMAVLKFFFPVNINNISAQAQSVNYGYEAPGEEYKAPETEYKETEEE